ncbi:MAG TPA: transcription elongation factor GreA, partial [Burkholderiales bacterium]
MKTPMTLRGAELLRSELQQLKTIERPKISQWIA